VTSKLPGLLTSEKAALEELQGGEVVTLANSQQGSDSSASFACTQTVTHGIIGRGVHCEIDKPLKRPEA
jgi:hypothetical protein